MYNSGDTFFGGMPPFFMLMFLLMFGLFIFSIGKSIAQAAKNAKSPIITVEAKIIAKRIDVSHHTHNTGDNNAMHTSSSTTYYITFETEHGERIELSLSGRMYGLLVEGDNGKLTYQGTWFKDFQRN